MSKAKGGEPEITAEEKERRAEQEKIANSKIMNMPEPKK